MVQQGRAMESSFNDVEGQLLTAATICKDHHLFAGSHFGVQSYSMAEHSFGDSFRRQKVEVGDAFGDKGQKCSRKRHVFILHRQN
jgi:hypothetical protein